MRPRLLLRRGCCSWRPPRRNAPTPTRRLISRVVLSDAQGFRRNDVRWSLSAASSMDAYAAGALVGSGNATLDAGAELALPGRLRGAGQLLARVPAAARRVRRGHRAAGLRHADARADGYTDVGATLRPTLSKMPSSHADLGANDRERVARAVHPAEPAADAPAFVQTHGGAHSAAHEPRAIAGAVRRADGAADRDADARSDAATPTPAPARVPTPRPTPEPSSNRRQARRRSLLSVRPACPCPCRRQYRRHCRRRRQCRRRRPFRPRILLEYPPQNPQRDRRRGARPRLPTTWALGRADEPPFGATIVATRTRAHAQAGARRRRHGGPDAPGRVLRYIKTETDLLLSSTVDVPST